MQSLSARLLLAVSLLLLVFFSITIYVLDLSFRRAAEEAVRERLDVHAVALLSVAEPENNRRLSLPEPVPETHFQNPGSGLFGIITRQGGEVVWRSPSLVGNDIPFPDRLATGERRFERLLAADGTDVFTLSLGIEWQLGDDQDLSLVVNVAESMSAFTAQVNRFRRQLLGWFIGLMFLLLTAQVLLLGWVLAPLRRAEAEVRAIEQGEREALGEDYPRELQGLTRHTNILLDTERARAARYKDTLGNLAHSIKTPLSVIRSAVDELGAGHEQSAQIDAQVSRVQSIVDYQLKRAAASRGGLSVRAIPVQPALEELLKTLQKVHRQQSLEIETKLDEQLIFLGDRGDLLEILGNVLDNAFKWAANKILISGRRTANDRAHGPVMQLVIEDDGPGIADEQREYVLGRGARADEHVHGHGIGLAVVKETVELLGGQLTIERSPLGGAQVSFTLPAR